MLKGAGRKFFLRKERKRRKHYISTFDPGPVNYDPFIWRPVEAGLCSLREVQEEWSMDDLLDAHELLDVKAEAEWYHRPKPNDKGG